MKICNTNKCGRLIMILNPKVFLAVDDFSNKYHGLLKHCLPYENLKQIKYSSKNIKTLF